MVTVSVRIGQITRTLHPEYDHLVMLDEAESQLHQIIGAAFYISGHTLEYIGGWEWDILVDSRKVGHIKWQAK